MENIENAGLRFSSCHRSSHADECLRRHSERRHSVVHKVWVCKNPPDRLGFLDSCTACRNGKTYGTNYNVAAHLRRTHFSPRKNKPAGRDMNREGRGGMGGGHEPSMEVPKHYMYERLERSVDGTEAREIISDGETDDTSRNPPVLPDSAIDQAVFEFDSILQRRSMNLPTIEWDSNLFLPALQELKSVHQQPNWGQGSGGKEINEGRRSVFSQVVPTPWRIPSSYFHFCY